MFELKTFSANSLKLFKTIPMKKYIDLFLFFLPLMALTQNNPTVPMWKSIGPAGFTPGAVYNVSLALSSSDVPYLAICDSYNDHKVSVMRYNGTFWEYVGDQCFTPKNAYYLSLAFSPSGELWIAYNNSSQSDKVSVMKFDGTSWVFVGSPGLSAGDAAYISLAFSSTGIPFIAYRDGANFRKISAMKYYGDQWVQVGTPGFSPGEAEYIRLAIDQYGAPYVSFQDWAHSQCGSVMKYAVNHWQNVGVPAFTQTATEFLDLAFSPDGQLYVSYPDHSNYVHASVKKFDGDLWVYAGQAGFTNMDVTETTIKFGPSGEPYVAVNEWIPIFAGYRARVMKFNGTDWSDVGNKGFSVNRIYDPSLAFNSKGQPILAYQDYGLDDKAVVMKYDSVSVGVREPSTGEFAIYPNPATTTITLGLKQANGKEVTCKITDVRGIVMAEARTSGNNFIVNVSDYPPGLYFVRINDKRSTSVGKFCKR